MKRHNKHLYFAAYPACWLVMQLGRWNMRPYWLWKRMIGPYTLGRALWNQRPEDAAYRFEMFGMPLGVIPSSVLLGGIRYRVSVAEGLIVFSESGGCWGTHTRICFERHETIWYLKFSETWERVPVSHVLKAWRYVEEVYGGNFEIRRQVDTSHLVA